MLSAAQRELGLMWQRGEVQVAEEHLGSGIVEEALGLLGSRIRTPPRPDRRALVAGVCGNLHTFGARIVAHHLLLAGWTTDYLGGDLPAPELAWAARERASQVVALSVMLPLHVRATAGSRSRSSSAAPPSSRCQTSGAPSAPTSAPATCAPWRTPRAVGELAWPVV